METDERKQFHSSKVLALRRNTRNSPLPLSKRPVRVKNLKDAKKLLGRLLVAFQRGEVTNDEARTMAHLLSTYVQIIKDVELEERISRIEQLAKGQ